MCGHLVFHCLLRVGMQIKNALFFSKQILRYNFLQFGLYIIFKGAYFAWKATSIGKNDVNAKTFLEKRFNETLELEDGIHTALLTLRESFDIGITEENVEVAICNAEGFRRLTKEEVKEHLSNL